MFKRFISDLFNQSFLHQFYDSLFRAKKVENFQKGAKTIFFMMCPNYGNIGDQAICVATIKFLQDNFKEYNLCTLDLVDTYKCYRFIKENIKPDDMIILQGGGNFGDLYLYIEKYRRFIIKKFKKTKIISMPVTCNFKFRRQLKRSVNLYCKHPRFLIFARDNKSFEFLSKNFKNRVEFLPDIVFYLYNFITKSKPAFERNNIILLLRSDIEQYNKTDRDKIINAFFSNSNNVFVFDTVVDRMISDSMRENEVMNFIKILSTAKLVVTDRMHGMILSVLTKTPCLVLKTKDGKLEETFELIKNHADVSFYDGNYHENGSLEIKNSVSLKQNEFDMFYKNFLNASELIKKV